MSMSVCLPVYMDVYHMCAWYLRRPKESVRSFGTVTGHCELPCGCWEPHLGPVLHVPLDPEL